MLGQLVAASVQRSGASVTPTPKVPAMVLDEAAKKDEISPEQLLAMFSMAVPQQVLPIDMPVEQAMQALPAALPSVGTAVAKAAEAPVQNILNEVAKQVTEAQVFAEVVEDVSQNLEAQLAPDSIQSSTSPFQLQQPHATGQLANQHVQHAITRPVHTPVGSCRVGRRDWHARRDDDRVRESHCVAEALAGAPRSAGDQHHRAR